MYKLKFVTALLVIAIMFTSCTIASNNTESMISEENDMSQNTSFEMESLDKISDDMFEEILIAISNQDGETIRALFSENALNDADDFDDAVEYLYTLFDGEVISWTRDTLSAGEELDHGKYSRLIRSWYTVDTAETRYLFFLLNYDKNTINPEKEGLYSLRGINADFAETQWGDWVEMRVPGIYMPET